MAIRLTNGDLAIAPQLCHAVIELRTRYKKLHARVAYLNRQDIGDDVEKKPEIEDEKKRVTEQIVEVQAVINERIRPDASRLYYYASCDECCRHRAFIG